MNLLRKLNPCKAIGPDMVPTSLLKDYAEQIGPILCKIYQQSLDTGIIPEDWLHANITAIYKKGNKTIPANYRPVSLTCISCKIIEHVIFSKIMDHSDKFRILKHYQHGFRKEHSCETQLLTTIEDISRE